MILKDFIISETIPTIKKQPKTFLGIAKQPHYENVLSNIFAFFFDPTEEHGFGRLFIDTLLEIIIEQEKYTDFAIQNFDVYTEFTTIKGGRIDILLKSDNESIIIENKIYHWLANDLKDYWDSCTGNSRVGIVFSTFPIYKTGHNWFFNLTHLDFLNLVMKNRVQYSTKNSTKFSYFLDDLYQNTVNLSKPTMKQEHISFFFENREKIEDTIRFKENMIEHVKNELEKTCHGLNRNLNFSRKGNKYNYFISNTNSNLMFTVVFDELFTDQKKLHLIIELRGKALHDTDRYNNLKTYEIVQKNFFTDEKKGWAHFAWYPITLLEDENILHLADHVLMMLKKHQFLALFDELETLLTQKQSRNV